MSTPPSNSSYPSEYLDSFAELLQTVLRLKNPGGCEWDRKQTYRSLRPYFLEEAYEVLEAIDKGDLAGTKEELGDILIHILFMADIAWRNGDFSLESIIRQATEKLQRRHPHVFIAPDSSGLDLSSIEQQWDDIKRAETGNKSILKRLPADLPNISIAYSILRKLSKLNIAKPLYGAISLAKRSGETDSQFEVRAGEALMSTIFAIAENGADPESALRGAIRVLKERVLRTEQLAGDKPLSALSQDEIKKLWNKAGDEGASP